MKRLLLFLLLPVMGLAQGVNVPGTALKTVNGITSPFAGATITVCAARSSGSPCSPALSSTLFQDEALTIPLANSFLADSNGNFNFFIAPGSYTVTITGLGFAGYSYQLTAQCPLAGSCVWTGTQNLSGALVTLASPTTTGTDAGIETLRNKTLQSPISTGTDNGAETLQNKTLDGIASGNSVTLLNKQDNAAALTGNAADQTVYTYTLPAGMLAAGKGFRVRAFWNHSTGTAAIAYKVSFGTDTLYSISYSGTGATGIVGTIFNKNALTNAQIWAFDSGISPFAWQVSTAGAQDTTVSQVLKFTFNVANTDQVTPNFFSVELIQ